MATVDEKLEPILAQVLQRALAQAVVADHVVPREHRQRLQVLHPATTGVHFTSKQQGRSAAKE